jgi:hypothetical protein
LDLPAIVVVALVVVHWQGVRFCHILLQMVSGFAVSVVLGFAVNELLE